MKLNLKIGEKFFVVEQNKININQKISDKEVETQSYLSCSL